jgi:cell wall-associated NlpC family hydrolase
MANVLQEQNGKLDPEQTRIAKQLIHIGKKKHVGGRAIVTALVTGLQESGLKNLPIGAESSGGWRQERAIYYPDPTNVHDSAERFYKELKERGGSGSIGEEAQAAQRSAYPSAYQPHVGEAREILKMLGKSADKKTRTSPKATGGRLTASTPSEGDPMDAVTNSSQVAAQAPSFLSTSLGKSAALSFINSKKDLGSISEFLSAKGNYQSQVKTLKEQAALTLGKKPTEEHLEGKPLHTPKEELKLNKVNPPGSSGHKLVNWADNVLGTNEGSPRQSKWAAAAGISPSTAWCSAFVAYGLRKEGYHLPSDPAYSGSWLEWNQGQHVKSYKQAKPGDLLIFDWGDGGMTDHVAIYAGHNQMISGNDSDNSVGKSEVPTGNIVGIVRPNRKK